MMRAARFLDQLDTAAREAETAEGTFRREIAQRIAALEQQRAFAFRRLNLMRSVTDAVAEAVDVEAAEGNARAVLRSRLGWDSDSEPRAAVLAHFGAIGRALFDDLEASEEADLSAPEALRAFEAWYAENHTTPFWVLFEHYIPETPLVDF